MNCSLKRTLIAGLGAILLLATTACGTERSTEAFCAVHDKHKERYLTAFEAASSNLDDGNILAGIAQAGSAVGDLTNMWKELAQAAPDEIGSDTEAIADGWQKQADRAGEIVDNPLKGLAGALGGALQMAGPMGRVDAYIKQNC